MSNIPLDIFSPCSCIISKSFYRYIREKLKDIKIVYNIGSGDSTRLGKEFWTCLQDSAEIINIDLCAGKNIDIVANAENLPLADESCDLVVLQAVLEHVQDVSKVIMEAKRVLKKGGYIYITMPFLQGYHADPTDYRRLTIQGLVELLKEFKVDKIAVSSGPFSTICWILRDTFTFGKRNTIIYLISRLIASIIFKPISFIDYIPFNKNAWERNACEYALIGTNR